MESNETKKVNLLKTYIDLKTECNSNSFCIEAALSEYIDNSIQSILSDYSIKKGWIEENVIDFLEKNDERNTINIIDDLKQYNLTVDIIFTHEKENHSLTSNIKKIIIKDNACGIEHDDLARAMNMSKINVKINKNSMHAYGVGMKISSFWLGNNTVIYTKRKGDNFVSKGNYNSPLDIKRDPRKNDDVVISIDKLFDEKIINKFNDSNSGTIIEVQAITDENLFDKMFDKGSWKDEKNLDSNLNIFRTLGMKYYKYLEKKILKINIITKNPNSGDDTYEIKPESLLIYNTKTKNGVNPFIIKEYFEKHKNELEFETPEEMQEYLKQELN
ncbi:MAG: ATP-binding protein, partial [Ureaplasma sp.]|nr:ATP-binding protein [Ureaplasma sp.]